MSERALDLSLFSQPSRARSGTTVVDGGAVATDSAAATLAPVAASRAPVDAELRDLPVDLIRRGRYQPRREFSHERLQELADSVRQQGVVQPVVVRPVPGGFELLAGERRWRAAQLAGLHALPAIVRSDVDDATAMEIAIVENLQREALSPIEEAEGIARLVAECHVTHEVVAQRLGKSREYVTNSLRLLALLPEVQEYVHTGQLSAGHAKALAGLVRGRQALLAREAAMRGLTVRQMEERIKVWGGKPGTAARRDPDVARLAETVGGIIGCPVTLEHRANGQGQMVIRYSNLDELDGLLRHLPMPKETT